MKLQGQFSRVRFVFLATTMMGALSVFAGAAQATTFMVTNTNNSGAGSLAQAILDANANPGADIINFNIPGGGVQTISPSSALPTITDPVTIDGYTQPGASPNSLALGTNAVLLIELSGAAGNSAIGLSISAGNSTIKGLVINRFNTYGIYLGTGGNIIAGNYIGTNAAGTAALPLPNNGTGVFMDSPNNTVGGSMPADRNVISGNGTVYGGTGVLIKTASAKGNKVIGNYIGIGASGIGGPGLGNLNSGIWLLGCSDSIIGGTTAAERNVITGNQKGISFYQAASSNQIMGNYIGPKADGTKGVYTNGSAIEIDGNSNYNTVGGITPGSGNLIVWNKGPGVSVFSSINNAILGNSIHDNQFFLGVDLFSGSGLGVTPNDDNSGDADTGANNLQNFPVLTSVTSSGGTTTISGTLDSAYSKEFRVELFANQACDPSGFGEGENYLGFTNVTTDGNGKGSFVFTVPTANVVGSFFTATATDPNGNTSEFSACASGAVNSPGTLQLSTNSVSDFENVGNFKLNVTRTNGSTGTVTVNYATADGTAKAPQDYTTTSGTLIFNDGETSKQLSVPIIDNNIPEGTHAFTISLSNPTGGAVLGNVTTADMSIQDNDYPTVSINDVSQAEGNSGTTAFTFTVTSSNAITNNISLTYSTADGTALAGSDYQSKSGTVTVPAGKTSATVTILVNGDTTAEGDEAFYVNLINPGQLNIGKGKGTGTIVNDDGVVAGTFEFSQPNYDVNEELGALTMTVTRAGDTSSAASVDYATVDGSATQKADYEYAAGTLNFAPGETSKTFALLINEDSYVEGNENLTVTLSNASGGALGPQSSATVTIVDDNPESVGSPIDDAQAFVYTHYHDFLNREPDPGGLAFWTNEIASCGNDQGCIDGKRVNVSASFFLSIEFQKTGYLRYLLNKESFGSMPKYSEFMRDLQEISRGVIVNSPGWEQKLQDNRQQFAEKWVNSAAFKAAYDSLSNADYVNKLYANAGILPNQSERDSMVNALDTASQDRAAILLEVADNVDFRQKESSPAFVLMQYFGYLRRDPDAAPDSDLSGYNFWLNKLNQFGGNYVDAEMVKAFITSFEYRQRFAQ